MKLTKGDYFIARQDQGKDYLARALDDSHSNKVESLLEKNCHIHGQRHTMTVETKNIKLNLGQSPHAGKVYGMDVGSLYYTKKEHPDFGTVYFFYKPDKQIVKDLWEAMTKVAKKLKRSGLEFLLDGIVWEVQPYNKEKYAGMFIKSKNEKIPDRIQFKPESVPSTEYAYVLFHEIGHNLHLSYATGKKINAHWLRLFNTSIRVATVKKELAIKLLDQLLEGEEPPSAFKTQLDEDDALAFKWIIRTIQSVNGLSIQNLDTLFEADMKDDIKKLWPTRTIPRKELEPIVSEYATKNYKELFAESFAFQFCGKKLPDQIVRLLDKSYSYAKANREK